MDLEERLRTTYDDRLGVVDLPSGDVAAARRTGAHLRARRRLAAVVVAALVAGGTLLATGRVAVGPAHDTGHWRELPAPPLSPRALALAVSTGREIIYLGGERRPCAPIVSCDAAMTASQAARAYGYLRDGAAYDLASGTWRKITGAPGFLESGSEAAFAAGHLYVDTSRGWFDYDVRTDSWSRFESRWCNGCEVSPVGDRIYGRTGSGRAIVYDVHHAQWTSYPADRIQPRLGGATVSGTPSGPVLAGYDTSKPYDIHHGSPTLVDVWDGHAWRRLPQTGQLERGFVWTGRRLVDPNVGAQDHGDEYTWDRAYPFGGILDPAVGTWQPLPAALEHQPSGGWDVRTSGYPAAAGGEGWFVVDGYVYNDNTGRAWLLPRPAGALSDYASAVWSGGHLIAFGGAEYAGQRLEKVSDRAWLYTP